MNLLAKLIIISLKNTFGLSALRDKYLRRKEQLWQPILVAVGIVAGFGTFAYLFMQFANGIVTVGNAHGQPEIVYTLAILGTQLLLLIMGIFLVISAFYFSDDLSILVPLPLKPAHILIAKLATVVVNEYLTSLALFIPAALAYWQNIGGSIAHYLSLLVVIIFTPVLPLVIAALVALAMMKVINRRHRDLLMVIASLIFVVLILGLNFSMQATMGNDLDAAAIQRLLSSRFGLLEMIGGRFPPAVWATKAIAEAGTTLGLMNMLAFIGITAAGLALLYATSSRLFYAGLIGGNEVSKQRKQFTKDEWNERTRQRTPLLAMFWREWKLFIRTPIFALNGFLGALIMPIALVFPLMAQGKLVEMLGALQSPKFALIAALGVAAMIVFMGSVNTIASTSVSREGKLLYISRMIPVAPEVQAQAKLLHGLVGAVVSSVPMLVAYVLLAKPTLLNLLATLLISLAGTMLGMTFGLYVDMRMPQLNWTNPQQAVKQNFNAVVPMLLMMVVIGLSVPLATKLIGTGLSYGLIQLVFFLLFAIPSVFMYRFTVGAAERLYHRLDI